MPMNYSPKQARLISDLSQEQVANKLGVHVQTYRKWEKTPDEMPVGTAKQFAEIVKLPVDEIFFVS
jgi:DNA-binding XRE family transcriptional regulator